MPAEGRGRGAAAKPGFDPVKAVPTSCPGIQKSLARLLPDGAQDKLAKRWHGRDRLVPHPRLLPADRSRRLIR
jgi:hypothetical protein